MKSELSLWKRLTSAVLALTLLLAIPVQSFAQGAVNRANLLENGAPVVLSVSENFKTGDATDNGLIPAKVVSDVYSADGTRELISAGTTAMIEYNLDQNGAWGKAGKICLTNATTKAVDNKTIPLRLNSCKKGGGKIGGVIALSILFFPIGLFSGFIKGSMPKIQQGTTLNTTITQDVVIE